MYKSSQRLYGTWILLYMHFLKKNIHKYVRLLFYFFLNYSYFYKFTTNTNVKKSC